MGELTQAARVVALLEWGDVPEADAEIDAAGGAHPGSADVALWRATRALMEGRFDAAERLNLEALARARAGGDLRVDMLSTLQLVVLRREQERPVEAESLLHSLLERHPSAPLGAHALLALLTGEMGRDSQARQALKSLMPRPAGVATTGQLAALCLLAELAAAVEAAEEIELLYRRLVPHVHDLAVETGGAVFYGSVSCRLARLSQAMGREGDAAGHFEQAMDDHRRAGAPVLLAHTERRFAAMLRVRGDDGDWERAVDLLEAAAAIYRQLGIDGLAGETQAVLVRARESLGQPDDLTGPNGERAVFHRHQGGWLVGPADAPVRLLDARGLDDIARLLAAPRAPVHVSDLMSGGGTNGALFNPTFAPRVTSPEPVGSPSLDGPTRAQYEARLGEIGGELAQAEAAGDPVRAALARAEYDALTAALADALVGDPLEQARKVVGTRIRISLYQIERSHPAVGRHLRVSIRTGTFCSYEPDRPLRWSL